MLRIIRRLAHILSLNPTHNIGLSRISRTPFVSLTTRQALTTQHQDSTYFAIWAFNGSSYSNNLTSPTHANGRMDIIRPLTIRNVSRDLRRVNLTSRFTRQTQAPFAYGGLVARQGPSPLKDEDNWY